MLKAIPTATPSRSWRHAGRDGPARGRDGGGSGGRASTGTRTGGVLLYRRGFSASTRPPASSPASEGQPDPAATATTVETVGGRLGGGRCGGEVLRGVVGDVSVAHLTNDAARALGVEQVRHGIHPVDRRRSGQPCTALFSMSARIGRRGIRDFYADDPRLQRREVGFDRPNDRRARSTDDPAPAGGPIGAPW